MIYNLLIAAAISAILSAGGTWKVLNTAHKLEIAELKNVAWQAEIAAQNTKTEIDLSNSQLAQAVAETHELKNRKRETVTKYVNKKVIEYVKSPNAGECVLNAEWVRAYNAAYSGSSPVEDNATH